MEEILEIESHWVGPVLLGCALLTVCSWVKIPMEPVPFTLQTLAIFILGLTQSPRQAAGSVLCYLGFATLGFPVLSASANSLWMLGKSSGYLIAFPFAAYLIAWMRGKVSACAALVCGQLIIFALGWLGLSFFVGTWIALVKGVLIFIPSAWCKMVMALMCVKRGSR